MRLLAPAYGYPGTDRGLWEGLAAAGDQVGHVIINPGSGPGYLRDAEWVTQVDRLAELGVPMLGYLDLAYARKPLSRLVREASVWRRWYGIVDFFLDCAPSQDVEHTSNVADLLRTTGRAAHLTANPGTRATPEVALHFDAVVEREGVPEQMPWHDEAGAVPHPGGPTERAWIVHGADPQAAQVTLDAARRRGVDEVWITDLGGANPYGALPSYWSWLLQAMADG